MKTLILTAAVALASVASTQAAVVITEVNPNGSSASYGADWFELTNTGDSPVDITGWKMDDNSFGSATAVAIRGVTSLGTGQSVVFLENGAFVDAATDNAKGALFTTAWFGSNAPAGLTLGYYGGSGVGLSSSGDGVEIFDASNNIVTGVQFGATTAGFTLDNSASAGATSTPFPTISTNSAAGTNGAFASADGVAVGSPGTAATPEPASLALAGLAAVGLVARRRRA